MFDESGSPVDELTDAVLEIAATRAGSTATTSVTVALAPFASAPRLQVTTPAASEHEPTDGVAETYEVPAGTVSLTVTAAALEGPAFATVIVYVTLLPAMTGSGESAFVIERSADGLTVVPWVDELFVLSGSVTPDETETVFEIDPAEPGVTTIVTDADAPAVIVPRLHVTVPPACEHEPCDGVAETNATPPGSVSLATTEVASDGPAFAIDRV